MIKERMCSRCKLIKPISEFTKNSNHISGYAYMCKACKSTYSRKQYHKTVKHKRAESRASIEEQKARNERRKRRPTTIVDRFLFKLI